MQKQETKRINIQNSGCKQKHTFYFLFSKYSGI